MEKLEIKLTKIESDLSHLKNNFLKMENTIEKVVLLMERMEAQAEKTRILEDKFENFRVRIRNLEALEMGKIKNQVEKLEKNYIKFATIFSVIFGVISFFGFVLKEIVMRAFF